MNVIFLDTEVSPDSKCDVCKRPAAAEIDLAGNKKISLCRECGEILGDMLTEELGADY